MNKTKILSLLLAVLMMVGVVSLPLNVHAEEDETPSENKGMTVNKTATVNPNGGYDITLEAYATGSKVITTVKKEAPVDIVLVLDQSGSMEKCIGCGKDITRNGGQHTIYSEVTEIDTSKSYYIKGANSSNYSKVTYCNGTHTSYGWGGATTTNCAGGAGWYTNTASNQHTAQNKYTPKTTDNSNGTQFYEQKTENCSSRLSALKKALNSFVSKVEEKAKGLDGQLGTADDVNHRIAVVGFAASQSGNPGDYTNTEVFVGSDQYKYGNSAQGQYKNAFQAINTSTGLSNVKASINALDANGGTHPNHGLEMANGIFSSNPIPNGETRSRVVVVFTDGVPGRQSFDSEVATSAISQAAIAKNTYGATVYAVGVFDGADPTSAGNKNGTETQKANWFMHSMSSNNGEVQTPGYYLSAGNEEALNSIFQQIGDQIQESGGSSTTMNESAVIKDIIAPQFQLPTGADSSNITLETWACTGVDSNGAYTWTKNDTTMGATAVVNGDKVDVTGFDFSTNWVGTETKDGVTTYRGNKLVIKFTVQVKEGFLGGNDVYTNTSAGVYENKDAEKPLFTFPRPTVNVPIGEVTVEANDKNVYLGQVPDDAQLKDGVKVKCGDVDITDPSKLEDWQKAYVDINVGKPTVSSGFDATTDGSYTVSASVKPKTEGDSSKPGTVATEKTGTATKNINVFKPELTFKDCEGYYGGDAPDYTGNKTGEVWKHGDTVSTNVTMVGTVPTLELTYNPESGKIENGKIETRDDIPVDVSVKINGQEYLNAVTFKHTKCVGDDNCKDPVTGGKFWIHVKTCELKITKNVTGSVDDDDDRFVFTVKGPGMPENGMKVVVKGGESVTIKGLKVGEYTVTEEAGNNQWSWRYEQSSNPTDGKVTLSAANTSGTVAFTNKVKNDKWLSDSAYAKNEWSNGTVTRTDGTANTTPAETK